LLAALWERHGSSITRIVTGLWTAVSSVISGALTIIQGVLDVFVGLFTGDWDRMGHGLMQIWRGLWHAVEGLLRGAWGVIGGLVTVLADGMREGFGRIRDAVTGAWSSMVERVRSAGESFGEYVRGLPDRLLESIRTLPDRFRSAGSAMIDALTGGIKSRVQGAIDSVANLASKLAKYVPGSPVRAGDLRVLNNGYAGGQIVRMLADGVEGAAPELARTTADAMPSPLGGRRGGSVARGAAQAQVPTVRLEVSDTKVGRLLVALMRDGVRARGGNVQVVLGGAA
jgi:phage-related protein